MTNPTDPAFNIFRRSEEGPICAGLTKREYFAAMAMHDWAIRDSGYPFTVQEASRRAVEFADTLIAELNKAKS